MPPSFQAPRRICVVGSINMDLVVNAPRFPGAGETILGGPFATFPGGKGANQAVAAARMGARVSMIARVGADAYGDQMRGVLDAEGIDTGAVTTTTDAPTGVAVITVAEGGGNTIVVAPGANARLTPRDVDSARAKIEAADVILLQLEVPLETARRTAELARSLGKCVILNAAPAQRLSPELLTLVDVLLVNEHEGEIVSAAASQATDLSISRTGSTELEEGPGASPKPENDATTREMLARLALLGSSHVIVTFGAAGGAWIHANRCEMISACRVTPTDTVGAGDSFCGALAAAWPTVSGNDARGAQWSALRIASAAGALATTTAGAIPSLPTLARVENFLKHTPP